MKRKVLINQERGRIEFSPPLIVIDTPELEVMKKDFRDWMDQDRYDALPVIDDDDYVRRLNELYVSTYWAEKDVLDRCYRPTPERNYYAVCYHDETIFFAYDEEKCVEYCVVCGSTRLVEAPTCGRTPLTDWRDGVPITRSLTNKLDISMSTNNGDHH